jgi:quinol monooxygenase YgiN
MLALSGYLTFPADDRDYVLAGIRDVVEKSRQDAGCIEYFWAADVDQPNTFRFFECWESRELFDAHAAAPYEQAFMADYVSRITAADAHIYEISDRRSAIG